MGEVMAKGLGLIDDVEKCNCRIITVAGGKGMLGEVGLDLEALIGKKVSRKVYVASIPEKSYNMIMGTDLLRPSECFVKFKLNKWRVKLGNRSYRVHSALSCEDKIKINVGNVKVEEKEYKKLFDCITYKEGEKLKATKRIKNGIDLIDDRAVYSKPQRYPLAFREIIQEHVKEMLATGVIRESVSTFNSPLWVVPKKLDKSGVQKYRVVVDYRELNKRTKTEKYPLSRLEEMIDRMAGSEVFSVIDLKSAYHQIPARDIEKTSFQSERGKYEFVRMSG
ncbi:hypothetical protein AAG570_008165 [Ranatra chinensis]|uniref:Reverse transcriptase domain-containing protein n=1 Tax=Ranatra chinensis TaxID=642074 RepID=A0ABD0XSD5_9HEMI